MNLEDMISAFQKKLGVQTDGRAGPGTWGAIHAHVVEPKIGAVTAAEAITPVDARAHRGARRCRTPDDSSSARTSEQRTHS